MKVKDLAANPKNPRTVTPDKLKALKKAIEEFGDLSGIVFNRKTGQLVGGHQRTNVLDAASAIEITKKYSKPTRTGTVAEGHVTSRGERYAYREVAWDKHREIAANVAANKGAGEWDLPQLAEWLKELGSFDVDFDLSLTMFDPKELAKFTDVTVGAHTRKKTNKDLGPPKCAHGQVYILGSTRLRCGLEELHFCDEIIAKYERQSGRPATLEEDDKPKKLKKSKRPAEQGSSRVEIHG